MKSIWKVYVAVILFGVAINLLVPDFSNFWNNLFKTVPLWVFAVLLALLALWLLKGKIPNG